MTVGPSEVRAALAALGMTASIVAAAALFAAQAGAQSPDSTASIRLLAIDAVSEGNTATSLGPSDGCVSVEPGADVTVDLVVDSIPADRPIIAYQLGVTYDPQVLEVTAADKGFLLGANGSYQPFEAFNDPLPDTDGIYGLAILDIASNEGSERANTESGPGVLARITFHAKASGTSTVAPGPSPDEIYPAVIDYKNELIDIDSAQAALIAVGEGCPDPLPALLTPLAPAPSATPTPVPAATPGPPSPTNAALAPDEAFFNGGGGGGADAVLIAVSAVLGLSGVALGAAGGWLLYRRRGTGTQT